MSDNTKPRYQFSDEVPIYTRHDGKTAYCQVPIFFFDLMRIGPGIPPAFWKLTFVLWRLVVAPKKVGDVFRPDFTAKTTVLQLVNEYRINKSAVADWSNAYDVSNLFTLTRGHRKVASLPGEPTLWLYRKEATRADWECFIIGLSTVLRSERRLARNGVYHKPPSHDKNLDFVPGYRVKGAIGFQLAVWFAVDTERRRRGLPTVRGEFLNEMIRRGHAIEEADGMVSYKWMRTDISNFVGGGDGVA